MDASSLVNRLVDGWHRLDADAIAACFAEDGVWHNMPYPPIRGRAAIRESVARFLATVESGEFRIRHSALFGPQTVVNERTDVFRLKSGRTLSIPVMGVFEVGSDGIIEWRDYFDSKAMDT
jgi:limonene-1,2-epoxide hydrolase